MSSAFDELLEKYVELKNKYDALVRTQKMHYHTMISVSGNEQWSNCTTYSVPSSIKKTGITLTMSNTTPTLTVNEAITL